MTDELLLPSLGAGVISEGRRWAGRKVVMVGQREMEERKRANGKRKEKNRK